MPLTPAEAQQIKIDIELLKSTSTQVLQAISEGTEQTKENNALINKLLNKMDSHDVRDEFLAKEREQDKAYTVAISDKIDVVNQRLDNMMPVYQSSKLTQENRQKFIDSLNSTWGKMAGALIIIALATALGLDLSSIIK
jgi:hypothetical protein